MVSYACWLTPLGGYLVLTFSHLFLNVVTAVSQAHAVLSELRARGFIHSETSDGIADALNTPTSPPSGVIVL